MKICLVTAFPPSRRQLTEYSLHLAKEVQRHKDVELTILADELDDEAPGTDGHRNGLHLEKTQELPGFHVVRCWKFGSLSAPVRLLSTIRRIKPDVVWFNLIFSSFGTPDNPFAAFAGLSIPALTRAAGFYTHITLHHIIEHVDFANSGVRREKLYRIGTGVATWTLLKAHSVSVLLSDYRRTLMKKYAAQNILVGTHGTFTTVTRPPDLSMRNNPETRILAFGHWGTYKRLETLMAAFPLVLQKIPNARLIVGGGNHPMAPGYLDAVRGAQDPALPIEFRGYIPQKDVPDLFRTSSVLIMPYDSSTGSSGPAHQACEFGVPIVCADIPDFRCMAADEDMAISFYQTGSASDLADKLVHILSSAELQRQMSQHNYEAGVQMSMASVVRNYLRWFELRRAKRRLAAAPHDAEPQLRPAVPRMEHANADVILDADLLPADASHGEGITSGETASEIPVGHPGQPRSRRTSQGSSHSLNGDEFADAS